MRMPQRLDTPEGREQYGQRVGTVEPVFGNLRDNKRLDRFTRRGRTKVNGQWLLLCLVHTIEKLTYAGSAAKNRSRERCAASRTTRSRPYGRGKTVQHGATFVHA